MSVFMYKYCITSGLNVITASVDERRRIKRSKIHSRLFHEEENVRQEHDGKT